MTLKSLVTGVAAVAAVGGAAAGVTSIASPAIASADVCGADAGTLQGVLNTLVQPGVQFNSPAKAGLVQGGVGVLKGRLADGALKNAYADGTLPTAISVDTPTCIDPVTAQSTVSAAGRSMPITFVNEGGTWKVSATSASTVLAAFA
ncbi:MAG TPA: hypothetical protein VJR50_27100 [Mycobacterium sp.]|nr:hypothetical protein [Mycobacterium sp.]